MDDITTSSMTHPLYLYQHQQQQHQQHQHQQQHLPRGSTDPGIFCSAIADDSKTKECRPWKSQHPADAPASSTEAPSRQISSRDTTSKASASHSIPLHLLHPPPPPYVSCCSSSSSSFRSQSMERPFLKWNGRRRLSSYIPSSYSSSSSSSASHPISSSAAAAAFYVAIPSKTIDDDDDADDDDNDKLDITVTSPPINTSISSSQRASSRSSDPSTAVSFVHRLSSSLSSAAGCSGSLSSKYDGDHRIQCDYVQLVPGSKRQNSQLKEEEEEKEANRAKEEEEEEEEEEDEELEAMCCSSSPDQIWKTFAKDRTSAVHPLRSFGIHTLTDFVEPWQAPSAGDRPMYDGPDLAPVDLPEDHVGTEAPVYPLDVARLDLRIPGYEDARYHRNSRAPPISPPPSPSDDPPPPRLSHPRLPPPPPHAPAAVAPSHEMDLDRRDRDAFRMQVQHEEATINIGCISESEARDALVRFVTERSCYGKSSAKEMDIYSINPSNALHYTLETYSECRSTSWYQEPYTGQKVDGPSNGSAPLPWDIRSNPTQMFRCEVRFLEVPHTATIACCYGCAALGWNRCHSCLGRGFKRCISCSGSGRLWKLDAHGHRHVDTCWHCHGTGRKRCSCCGGDGRVVCTTCQGYRNLKCFIKLRVEYKNDISEQIIDRTDLPSDLIRKVSGEIILEHTQPKVHPIADFPDDELVNVSHELIQQHQCRTRNARVIIQRQRLRAIAISECSYTWVNSDGRFWVYGRERAVYAPEYPQRHCWGCRIL